MKPTNDLLLNEPLISVEKILKPGITRATMKGLVYGGPGVIVLKK